MEKLNKNNYEKLLIQERNNLYTFLEEYISSKTPILCKCNNCNNEWKVSPYEIIKRKSNCPICSRKKANENKKLSNEEIQSRLNDYYILLDKYKGINKKIKIKCKKCGYEFNATPSNLLKDNKNKHHMCRNCFNIRRRENAAKRYQQHLDNYFGKEKSYDLLEEYQGLDTKILHRCRICNYEWKVTPNNINLAIYRDKVKRVCPNCNNLKRVEKTYEERLKDVNSVFIPIEKYINLKTKIKHKCKICNKVSDVIPNNALKGSGCRYCNNKIIQSKYELKLVNFIKEKYNYEVIEKDRKILNGKELDIYIPERKLAIEVNGLYYHCADYKDKNYHLEKTNLCKQKGITLIHIFDDYDLDKVHCLLDQYLLEEFKSIKKYKIKEIDKDIAIKFIKDNSLIKNEEMTIQLGLFINNEIISVLTFNKNEITNFSMNIKYNYSMKELFSYLFEYFNENYIFKKIYKMVDLSYEDVNIYFNKNFKIKKTVNPDYFVFDRNLKIRIDKNIEGKSYKKVYNCGYFKVEYQQNE